MLKATFTHDNNVEIIVTEDVPGCTLFCRSESEVLFRKIHEYLINAKILQRNVIDLGAWIGDNAIPWAKNISGTVYAIDPSDFNCTFIETICQINDVQNVKVFPYAISSTEELLSTNESLNHCSFVFDNLGTSGKNKVKSVSLDKLYSERQIEDIGYIHLDVEGMEYKVMVGASNLITNERPIITFEQHIETDDVNDCCNFLTSKQYTIFMIDEILKGCRPDCRNFIAFPSELYTDLLRINIHAYVNKDLLLPIETLQFH